MNTVDKIYQLNTVILPMFMFCICKIQLIYWKEGKGGRTDRRGNEEILHKRGVLGKKFKEGPGEKSLVQVF